MARIVGALLKREGDSYGAFCWRKKYRRLWSKTRNEVMQPFPRPFLPGFTC